MHLTFMTKFAKPSPSPFLFKSYPGTRRHVFKCVSDQWACGEKLSVRCVRLPACSRSHCPCPSSCPISTISITERLTKKTCNRKTSTTSLAVLISPAHWVSVVPRQPKTYVLVLTCTQHEI